MSPNQFAAAYRRPTEQSDGSEDLSATPVAAQTFPTTVAELGRSGHSSFLRHSFVIGYFVIRHSRKEAA